MGNLASAFARLLKPVTVEVVTDSKIKGEVGKSFAAPVDRIFAPLTFSAKVLKFEEPGKYTVEDVRFFVEGAPEFKGDDRINWNGFRYVVMEPRHRDEGNFTIYMSKRDQATAGP